MNAMNRTGIEVLACGYHGVGGFFTYPCGVVTDMTTETCRVSLVLGPAGQQVTTAVRRTHGAIGSGDYLVIAEERPVEGWRRRYLKLLKVFGGYHQRGGCQLMLQLVCEEELDNRPGCRTNSLPELVRLFEADAMRAILGGVQDALDRHGMPQRLPNGVAEAFA